MSSSQFPVFFGKVFLRFLIKDLIGLFFFRLFLFIRLSTQRAERVWLNGRGIISVLKFSPSFSLLVTDGESLAAIIQVRDFVCRTRRGLFRKARSLPYSSVERSTAQRLSMFDREILDSDLL